MKRFFLALIAFSIISVCTQAQTKKESIKILFGLMKQDTLINKTFENMTASIVSGMASQTDSSFSGQYSKIMEKSLERTKEIAKKLLNEDMVDIYDKYFTQEEINDFIAFYKSGSGQKMISMLPAIQKDIMTAMSLKYSPGLHQEIDKTINESLQDKKQ